MEHTYQLYSSLPKRAGGHTVAEIDLSALQHNYRVLQKEVEKDSEGHAPRIIAVVKADAYGHGAPACVEALLEVGCDFFAVSCIEEARAVSAVCRENNSRADILILGYTDPKNVSLLSKERLIQAIHSPQHAQALSREAQRAGVRIRAHIAVDTGMHRVGFGAWQESNLQTAAEEIRAVCADPALTVEGAFTHFACADDPKNPQTDRQSSLFHRLTELLRQQGVALPFLHACNSAAAILRPHDRMDGVRPGILLYGISPSAATRLPLQPVMRLKTVIAHLHPLPAGEALGYGGDFCADRDRFIATLPIGYADGVLRGYSGGTVTVNTREGARNCPIVGRVCMDQCMIDVTDTVARVGDTVVLFGDHPHALSQLAARAGTVEYECLCAVSARVPRVSITIQKESFS